MLLCFPHMQSYWPWSIYSFNWGRVHTKYWKKEIQHRFFHFQASFLREQGWCPFSCLSVFPQQCLGSASATYHRRQVWQRMRCIPADSLTSLLDKPKPKGINTEGKPREQGQHKSMSLAELSITMCVPARWSNEDLWSILPLHPLAKDNAGTGEIPAQGKRGEVLPE